MSESESVRNGLGSPLPVGRALVAGVLSWLAVLPIPAAAEPQWIDLFPLMGKVILLGLPMEIGEFCYHMWPLAVVFAILTWVVRRVLDSRGWRVGPGGRLPFLLQPVGSTALAVLVVVVAMIAAGSMDRAQLKKSRFAWSRIAKTAFAPLPAVEKPRPIIAVVPPDGRAWPSVATEFTPPAPLSTEYSGVYALEIDNRIGRGGVFVKLCAGEATGCAAIRTMFIPKNASITIRALAGRSYRLHYRLVADERQVAQSREFELPGKEPFFSAYTGAGVVPKTPVVGNGSFEPGDAVQPALITLPASMVSMEFNPVKALFKLIQPKAF